MRGWKAATIAAAAVALLAPGLANAEILAMVNYESKPEDTLKALKISGGPTVREEGIAVIDVDPESANFGKILMDIPLPPDLVAHHIFYDKSSTKAYVTALSTGKLHVIDLKRFPWRLELVEVPECAVGEDVAFSADNTTWYLTCMGSENVVVGDVATDEVTGVIHAPGTYPHGFAVHQGIDRALISDTVNAADLGDPGEAVTVVKASTNEVLGALKVSDKPSPAGEAPVEILFVPGVNPPIAFVTNMYGGTVWAAVWNPGRQEFEAEKVLDVSEMGAGVPLEMYFNREGDRFYLTTAKPGHLHIFDISQDPLKPKLIKTLATAEGAHHVAFTQDERYGFVQNSLLNLPGMSDGSITVVDLRTNEVVASVDTFKDRGYNPNSIVLLPEWNSLAGH